MKKIPIEPGRAVLSKAGRDAGRRFVVISTEDIYAKVADGDLRHVESPKKKKHMHLRPLPEFFPSIAAILEEGRLPSNAELRKSLCDRPPRED